MGSILSANDVRTLVEYALDRELPDFDMEANLYEQYGLDSMGAVAMFVELELRTGVEIAPELAPLIQTGSQIARLVQIRASEKPLDANA